MIELCSFAAALFDSRDRPFGARIFLYSDLDGEALGHRPSREANWSFANAYSQCSRVGQLRGDSHEVKRLRADVERLKGMKYTRPRMPYDAVDTRMRLWVLVDARESLHLVRD